MPEIAGVNCIVFFVACAAIALPIHWAMFGPVRRQKIRFYSEGKVKRHYDPGRSCAELYQEDEQYEKEKRYDRQA